MATACSSSGTTGADATTTVPGRAARVATSATCAIDARCLAAIDDAYGLALAAAVVALPDRLSAGEGLARGALDVAVTDADDPYLAGAVLLTDDAGALPDRTLVPVANAAALELAAGAITSALLAVGTALDTQVLASLRAAVEVDGRNPGEAAADWLRGAGLAPGEGTSGVATLTVGATASVRSRLLAEVVARALTGVGIATSVTEVAGGTAGLLGAVEDGRVALVVDDGAALLETANGFAGEATTDRDATLAALDARLGPRGLVVLDPFVAAVTTVVAVDAAVASGAALRSIGDLATVVRPAGDATTPRPTTTGPTTTGGPTTSTGGLTTTGGPDTSTDPATTAVGPPAAEQAAGLTPRRDGLGVGSTGPFVVALQDSLRAAGLGTRSTGVFDQDTRRAVQAAQRRVGLLPDGVATAAVADALRSGIGTVAPFPRPGDEGMTETEPTVDGRPTVYLVVAGGPDPAWTPRVLQMLDLVGASATFAIVGAAAGEHPEMVRRVLARGNGLAVGTREYAVLSPGSTRQLAREVSATRDHLAAVADAPVPCVLLPAATWLAPAGARADLAGDDAVVLGVDIDPQDLRRPGGAVLDDALATARPGDVVLVHDGLGDRDEGLRSLEVALQQWTARGWQVGHLPGCRPTPPARPTPPTTIDATTGTTATTVTGTTVTGGR